MKPLRTTDIESCTCALVCTMRQRAISGEYGNKTTDVLREALFPDLGLGYHWDLQHYGFYYDPD